MSKPLTPERLAEIEMDSNLWGDLIEATRDEVRSIIAMAKANADLVAALREAACQLAYLDSRFPTGTTPAVLQRLAVALTKAEPQS